MQLTLIFDGLSECWVGRVGGVEVPLPSFHALAHNLRAHYEIMANDTRAIIVGMRREYMALKQCEMSIAKSKSAASEFKILRQRQEKQLKAIQALEAEEQKALSAAEYFHQMTDIAGQNMEKDPRYVIRG